MIAPSYPDGFGALVIHFGEGRIEITHGHDTEGKYDELVLVQSEEPHPIGANSRAEWGPERTSNEARTLVRMVFGNVESLDVLIERAQALRAKMVTK